MGFVWSFLKCFTVLFIELLTVYNLASVLLVNNLLVEMFVPLFNGKARWLFISLSAH